MSGYSSALVVAVGTGGRGGPNPGDLREEETYPKRL